MENKRFFFHPKPIEGELLSSWLTRIALLHRISPVTFMNIHFPQLKPDIWSRDVDLFWGTKPDLMALLSYKSRMSVDALMQCTLDSYEGYLTEKIYANTRNKLITSIVTRGRESRSKGLRFCPECLKSDVVPYFRKEWRLSFVTTCLKHRSFLRDCCPKCKSPLNIYKLIYDDLCTCYKCNASYTEEAPELIPNGSYGMEAQKKLLGILYSGMFEFEGSPFYSPAYFDGLKQMGKIIYNFNMREGIEEHEVFHKFFSLPSFTKRPMVCVEDISLKEQYLIYSASEYILQSFAHANRFCERNNIGRTELTSSMEYIPYWYEQIVLENDHSQYTISLKEALNALSYMQKNSIPISFNSLSALTGMRAERRKRKDIAKLIDILESKEASI